MMDWIQKHARGGLLCLLIAVPSWLLGQRFPVIGGPVFGIVAGMAMTLFLKDKSGLQSGITLVSKKVL